MSVQTSLGAKACVHSKLVASDGCQVSSWLLGFSPQLCHQVLESIPLSMQVEDHIWIFKVPSQQPLGDTERDYCNVEVQRYELKTEAITVPEDGAIGYFSVGRLGALTGGLLHVADVRQAMTQEDIGEIQARDFNNMVVAKEAEATEARQKLDLKRKRSEELLTEAKERKNVVENKHATAEMQHRVWKTVWSHIARGEDHTSKAEGQTWKDYFLQKTGNEPTIDDSCPASMCVADLPFEDMLMQLATHVSKLKENLQKLETSLAKATALVSRQEKRGAKAKEVAQRKIQKLSDPNIEEAALTLASFSYLVPNA